MAMHVFVSDHPSYRALSGEPVELLYVVPISESELGIYGACFMVETPTGHRFEAYREELEFFADCP